MRVLSIVGARPQFIKHAIMQKSFPFYGVKDCLVHTGQHFDFAMSEVFFQSLQMSVPNYCLGETSLEGMLKKLKGLEEECDCVMVYGDTTSTLAGALYAKERGKKLVHIEAGLRSFDMQMPEERNRILTDRLSDLLFAPTKEAVENLKNEGFMSRKSGFGEVVLSGDIMQDGFEYFSHFALPPQGLQQASGFVLCTLHRQSNVDHKERLEFLVSGLNKIAQEEQLILPLHPHTHQKLQEFGLQFGKNVTILPPQGYLQMLWLIQNAKVILTDSGGLQKEAFFAKKKTLVLRERSEWVELCKCGASELLGDRDLFVAYRDLGRFACEDSMIYGGGKSVKKILQTLVNF